MAESVWIIYRVYDVRVGLHDRKVEGVVYTEEQAIAFAEALRDRMDDKFGIDIQEWVMDAER
jgi:hypothetical protein